MNIRFKAFLTSMLAVMLIAGQSQAVSIKGKDISTIPDILRWSRGLTGKDVTLELRKDSLLCVDEEDYVRLFYNIGNGDNDSKLDKIKDAISNVYPVTFFQKSGTPLALAQTKFNSNKVLVASSSELFFRNQNSSNSAGDSNWLYDLYFFTVGKNDDGNVTQSRFGAWRYPYEFGGGNSGYLKDIDTGIFVEGFDGELVVASTMTATNDNYSMNVNYNSKAVGARFDFWALYKDDSGDVQYKKLNDLNQTKSGFETAPLWPITNIDDSQWGSPYNDLTNTHASPYMVIKTATGDFNNDGYANEVAVLATDVNGIYIWMYQLEYNAGSFTIRTIKEKTTIFSCKYPDYFRRWQYNGWNRVPGADILAGDFDGDGETELAVIFQGDFTSSEHSVIMFGGTVKSLHTNLYKWDNNTGDLKVTANEVKDCSDIELKAKAFDCKEFYSIGRYGGYRDIKRGHTRRLEMSWGGFKATVLDIDGDGKDEIAFAGYRSEMYYKIKDGEIEGGTRGADHHAEYKVWPYLSLVKINSEGKLASSRIFNGDPIINNRYTSYNGWDEDNTNNMNAFQLQEYKLAPVAENAEVYPFADREISITAGAFYGQTGLAKERDDLALRLYGNKMILFKSDGSTLKSTQTLSAEGTSALVAADFAGEGIELGNPTFVTRVADKSYMALIQAPPFHVDTVSLDGQSVTPNPVNFSYTANSQVSYGKKEANSSIQTTKFDMHSSVETIFALDTDLTKNIIGGARTAQSIYGTVKSIASIIPGTSYFENAVNKAQAVDGAVSSAFNFLDKITDKVETIKKGYNEELTQTEVFSRITANDQDMFGYVEANQYIWRYPVVTKPAPNLYILSDDAKYLTKQDFVTFTIYGDRTPTTGVSASDYQPKHENGNLFSYPPSVENIEEYAHKQKVLSNASNIQYGANTDGYSDFSQVKTDESTESKKVSTGYLTNALSLVDSLFGTDLAKVPEGESGPTYTRKESSAERIDWAFPRAGSAPLDRGYTLHYQAYVAENGAVTCGFAVSDFNRNLNLFNNSSVYSLYPDPAFPLPYKFKNSGSGSPLPAFNANPSRNEAMEIRGVRFYARDYNRFTSSRLLQGARYRVYVPIYNASFVAAAPFEVSLYWVKDREESTLNNPNELHLIETKTVSSLPGWSNIGNNKDTVSFDFTPTMEGGKHYQLYAVIDPKGSLTEVHEKRDLTKDSGGNNEGYFEFSVETVDSARTTASFYASDFKASFTEDDIVFPDMTYGGYSTWNEFYNAKIANTEGPVEMSVTITNKMDITIPNVEIIAVYFDPELWTSENEIGCVHFVRDITLFPNETYAYTFTIPGNVADDLRRVGADNTTCSYTPRSLFELIFGNETEPGLIGDENPELEVYDGGAVSQDEEPDDTRYYDTVISRTYELSHDVSVFWRINGIADVISNTGTEDSYVKDSAVSAPATQEDFTLVWSPSDAGSVRAAAIELTISTIPGMTRFGEYAFTIQTSEDGENWTEKDALIFGSSDSGSGTVYAGSSSGGCDAGYSALGLMLAVLMIRRRTR